MGPIDQLHDKIESAIYSKVTRSLSQTPYSIASFTKLGGGSVNYVYRGMLNHPLTTQDGTVESVILKHSTNTVAKNPEMDLDVGRCHFEELILRSLKDLPPITATEQITVKTPHLYQFIPEINTQVIEDIPNAVDMLESLTSDSLFNNQALAMSIGHALGSYLRSFHTWVSAPAQEDLSKELGKNVDVRKLKSMTSYESYINILEKRFPDVLQGHEDTLQQVRRLAQQEYERSAASGGDDWGIIHGDFWLGNILLQKTMSSDAQTERTDLFVIDWEFAQFGNRAYDLGEMIGDLLERKHLKDSSAALWIMEGFVEGYGTLTEDMAFRTAIHAGVHMICWYLRRLPGSPILEDMDKLTRLMEFGRDCVVHGKGKNRRWFEAGPLACLFKGVEAEYMQDDEL